VEKSLEEKLVNELWSELLAIKSFPEKRPLLAHYTSINTFESIMENNEIWFSNPLHMNDLEELRFGMIEGAKAFRENQQLKNSCKDSSKYSTLIETFDNVFNEFDLTHAFNTYVLCLSEHDLEDFDGILSMWRGYGESGNGVAIVFDSSKIEENSSSPLIIDRVTYGTKDERLEWIQSKINTIAATINEQELTDVDMSHIALLWFERLKLFSLYTKHIGFQEEKEWRVSYLSERDKDNNFADMLGYSISPRGVEPKLKLKIEPKPGVFSDELSISNIVDRIILGPTTSTPLAAKAVQRILELKGKQELVDKIYPSTIPFRQ